MADQTYQLQPSSTGPNVDLSELTVSGKTVERQRICIGDPTTGPNLARVDSSGNLYVNVVGTITNSPIQIGGAFTALPTPTTNGAVLTPGNVGIEFTIPPGCSVTYTIATVAPVSAPGLVRTTSNPASAISAITDQINLSSSANVYLTGETSNSSTSQSPFYRPV